MYEPLNVAAYAVLIPAYGRRPIDELTALQEFRVGLDWVFLNPTSMNHGKYCSIRDIPSDKLVELRHGQNHEKVITIMGMVNPRLLILANNKKQYSKWCKMWEINIATHIPVYGLDDIPENFMDAEYVVLDENHILVSSLEPESDEFMRWTHQNRVVRNYILDPIIGVDEDSIRNYMEGIHEGLEEVTEMLKTVQEEKTND